MSESIALLNPPMLLSYVWVHEKRQAYFVVLLIRNDGEQWHGNGILITRIKTGKQVADATPSNIDLLLSYAVMCGESYISKRVSLEPAQTGNMNSNWANFAVETHDRRPASRSIATRRSLDTFLTL